jgi:isoleucyl-tRNA synthetase
LQMVTPAELHPIDRFMLHRLSAVIQEAAKAEESFEFHRMFQLLHNFCSIDCSAMYFDILKDRLYADRIDSSSRRAAQTVLYHILHVLVRLLAPILVHTTEEVWAEMKVTGLSTQEEPVSVHLAQWITASKDWNDPELAQTWERLFQLRSDVQKLLEQARNQKQIGHPYEACIRIKVRGAQRTFLANHLSSLASFFIVSSVILEDAGMAGAELQISVEKAVGQKCERCWQVLGSVGKNSEHPTLCERCTDVVVSNSHG